MAKFKFVHKSDVVNNLLKLSDHISKKKKELDLRNLQIELLTTLTSGIYVLSILTNEIFSSNVAIRLNSSDRYICEMRGFVAISDRGNTEKKNNLAIEGYYRSSKRIASYQKEKGCHR